MEDHTDRAESIKRESADGDANIGVNFAPGSTFICPVCGEESTVYDLGKNTL